MLNNVDPEEKKLLNVSGRINSASARSGIKTARGNATEKWFLTEYKEMVIKEGVQ